MSVGKACMRTVSAMKSPSSMHQTCRCTQHRQPCGHNLCTGSAQLCWGTQQLGFCIPFLKATAHKKGRGRKKNKPSTQLSESGRKHQLAHFSENGSGADMVNPQEEQEVGKVRRSLVHPDPATPQPSAECRQPSGHGALQRGNLSHESHES